VVLRQEHKAGEKMVVDWAGATIPVYDATTGQAWSVSLFVETRNCVVFGLSVRMRQSWESKVSLSPSVLLTTRVDLIAS
jgi:hypothetical protein